MVSRPAAPMSTCPSGERRTTRRPVLKLLCAAAAGSAALRSVLSFAGPSAAARCGVTAAPPSRAPAVAAAAFAWDIDEPPRLPQSPEEMTQQAADAVMRAYRTGATRQAVRFRLDELFDMESLYVKGNRGLLNATVDTMEGFARKLWGGESLKKIKTSLVDQDTTTLIYRLAENAMQDAAVVYLPGREFMAESKTQVFFGNMKDRLVVLANTENSPSAFQIDNFGKDWLDLTDIGYKMCNVFREQSYYLSVGPFNQWRMTTFRVFPFKWQVFIETLDYKTIKLGEFDQKPEYDQLMEKILAYEEENNVAPLRKVGKMLKDFRGDEEASEAANPGWRSAQSSDDILEKNK